MKKRMLKVVCVLMVILSVMTTGCSANTDKDTKMTTKYCIIGVTYDEGETADDFHFTELVKGSDAECYELAEQTQELVISLEESLHEYLNERYNLEWEFKSTNVRMLDFSKVSNGEYTYYAAMADPEYETVYVNSLFVNKEKDLVYRLAHEFIHCMRYYNIGTTMYVLKKEDNSYIGYYTGESFTDLIAADFLETLGEDAPLDYFLNGSGYCYTTVALQVLDYSIENSKKMYLENNMQEFYTALKTLSEEHIADGKEVNYAEKFIYNADVIIYSSNNIMYATSTEKYNLSVKFFLNAIWGNYEIALSVSDSLDKAHEDEVFELVKHIYELEGMNDAVEERLSYIKTCLD